MRYLEKAVLSESRTLAERIVCGKLRMCSQASIRHDDLERTPLSLTEWVRLKGGVEIIGMRACPPVTKSGVRPWVASYLAVSPENDAWMSTFIELVGLQGSSFARGLLTTGQHSEFHLHGQRM